ncbi:Chagasin family peptidase inhibitor I42 [uncultured archaeon]|nr:Chagasin family peptidase inhibitor I42 [uncultured archaeon]
MADYKRLFIAAVFAALALSSLLLAAQAEVRVCPSGCGNTSIQEAVNAAAPQDKIVVESGTYREDLIVGRPVLLQGLDIGLGRPLLAPENGRIILAAQGATVQGFELAKPRDLESGNCTIEVVLPAAIYLNNIAGSESICPEAPASWNSSLTVNYQFNSRVMRSRLGNYWADYQGPDENADGIGDEPKVLDENNIDYYPLMQPMENYVIQGEKERQVELIRAKVGQTFTVALPANPGTGYQWNADYDYYLLSLESSQFEKASSERVGASGESIFVFKPLRPGKTTISLVYKKSWENIAADVRTIHVEITS